MVKFLRIESSTITREGTRASKDVEPQRGCIATSHIDWRGERVLTRMLGHKGGVLRNPTSIGEGNEC